MKEFADPGTDRIFQKSALHVQEQTGGRLLFFQTAPNKPIFKELQKREQRT
jgi:hypothetical protein